MSVFSCNYTHLVSDIRSGSSDGAWPINLPLAFEQFEQSHQFLPKWYANFDRSIHGIIQMISKPSILHLNPHFTHHTSHLVLGGLAKFTLDADELVSVINFLIFESESLSLSQLHRHNELSITLQKIQV